MRPITLSFRLIAAMAFAAGMAGCSSDTTDGGPGVDSGAMDAGPVDAGPTCVCAGLTEACSASHACCANLTCTGGKCVQATAASCTSLGSRCTASTECCGSVDQNIPGYPSFTSCVQDGLGVGRCLIGTQGSSCSATQGCAFPLSCSGGTCKLTTTGATCSGSGCHAGDQCNPFATDVCRSSGLVCVYPGLCLPSQVITGGSSLGEASICTAGATCVGQPGSSAATTCGTYSILDTNTGAARPLSACVEKCQSPSDCSNIAWDCNTVGTQKQCSPTYCYAADLPQQPPAQPYNVAQVIQTTQTATVSNSSTVLFKPCGAGAGPNTYCLPYYTADWGAGGGGTTVGYCTQVGGAGAGGIGAACQPNPSPSNGPGLCAAGSLCYRGTCHAWCDINNPVRAGCDPGQACIAAGEPFSTSFSTTDSTGVCTNICDPYQPAEKNTCPQSPTWTCDNPAMLCKANLPATADSDQFPQPGVCAGGLSQPIPVGMPCSTGLWVDPCVSGAFCTLPAGGGNTRICAQVCDVVASPLMVEPACPTGQTCISVDQSLCSNPGRDGGYCKAFGTCQ